ncbi:MAG: HEPN domain-containing protein [Nitrospirota bacterium]
MKKRPDVLEWITKAEQDYQTAVVMARKRKVPVPDVVGFHSQQCIEKYLKALLVLNKLDFPKTHDLLDLLAILTENEPLLDVLKPELRILNPFSVQFRYPGESATIGESQKALTAMKHVRKYLKDRFSF